HEVMALTLLAKRQSPTTDVDRVASGRALQHAAGQQHAMTLVGLAHERRRRMLLPYPQRAAHLFDVPCVRMRPSGTEANVLVERVARVASLDSNGKGTRKHQSEDGHGVGAAGGVIDGITRGRA